MSKEARQLIMDETVKNIQAFLDHQSVNLVNCSEQIAPKSLKGDLFPSA